MGVSIEVDEARIELRNIAKRSSRAIRRAMDRGTELLVEEIVASLPVDTGLFRESIHAEKSDGPGRKYTEILIDPYSSGALDSDPKNPRDSKKYGSNRKKPVEKYGAELDKKHEYFESAADYVGPIIEEWIDDALERGLK